MSIDDFDLDLEDGDLVADTVGRRLAALALLEAYWLAGWEVQVSPGGVFDDRHRGRVCVALFKETPVTDALTKQVHVELARRAFAVGNTLPDALARAASWTLSLPNVDVRIVAAASALPVLRDDAVEMEDV